MDNGNRNGAGAGRFSRWVDALLRRQRPLESALAPYRRLAMQLHYDLPRPDSVRSTLVVTPATSILNAYGSLDLARCLADALQRPVLLVDACPRAPELTKILNCTHHSGLADLMSDTSLSVDELVLPTSHGNLSFLPAGKMASTPPPAPPDDMRGFLQTFERRYEFMVLCGGAVLTNPLTLAVAPCVGRVLLLVIEDETKVEDLDAAQDALRFCKADRVGLVLTSLAM
jgi:MinD-like ATPase involved in chromosome partitioning or flagellar assembly